MGSFAPCRSCGCLVRRGDATCPFCNTAVVASPLPSRALPLRRISRGAWFSLRSGAMLGAVATTAAGAVVACARSATDDTASTEQADAAARVHAVQSDILDASDEADVDDGGRLFGCGSHGCLWPAQYCEKTTTIDISYRCGDPVPATGTETYSYRCVAFSSNQPNPSAESLARCKDDLSCACFIDAGVLSEIYSHDPTLDARCSGAGVTVNVVVRNESCGGCYGSPPARLERLVA